MLVEEFTHRGKHPKVRARWGLKLTIAIIDHDRQTERRGETHVFQTSLPPWRSLSRGGRVRTVLSTVLSQVLSTVLSMVLSVRTVLSMVLSQVLNTSTLPESLCETFLLYVSFFLAFSQCFLS